MGNHSSSNLSINSFWPLIGNHFFLQQTSQEKEDETSRLVVVEIVVVVEGTHQGLKDFDAKIILIQYYKRSYNFSVDFSQQTRKNIKILFFSQHK